MTYVWFAEYMGSGNSEPADCTAGLASKRQARAHATCVAKREGYIGFWLSRKPDGSKDLPVRVQYFSLTSRARSAVLEGMGVPRVPLTVFTECGNGINLDGESMEALESFSLYRGSTEARAGLVIFQGLPASTRKRAITMCARYACYKATAMRDRAAGNIGAALCLESACERIYAALPRKARW